MKPTPLDDLDPRDRRVALATLASLLSVLLFVEPGRTHAVLIAVAALSGALLIGLLARSRELRWTMLVGLLPTVLIIAGMVDLGLSLWVGLPAMAVCGIFAQREPGDTALRWSVRAFASFVSAALGAALSLGVQTLVDVRSPWVLATLVLLAVGFLGVLARRDAPVTSPA